MSTVNTATLIRSLQSVNRFIDGKEIISNGNDFVTLYETNIKLLKQVGEERGTPYYKKRIAEFPEIFAVEIDEFIRGRDGTRTWWYFIGGYIWLFILTIIRVVKSNGRAVGDVSPKLEKIKSLHINFISVLEKPGLEDLIERNNG